MSEEASSAADAFGLLSDEVRLAIVEELANYGWNRLEPTGLSFAELRRAVDVRDAGRFNYHLGELRGTFVARSGETYHLTNAGWAVAGIVASGRVGGTALEREATLDAECPAGDALTATYEDDMLRAECPDHGVTFARRLPSGAVRGRSLEEALDIAINDMHVDIDRALDGVCPHCWGHADARVATDATVEGNDGTEVAAVLVVVDCPDCGLSFEIPPALAVLSHPAVVAFFADRGVDLREANYLAFEFIDVMTPETVSTDPLLVELPVEHDGERLSVVLDAHATVVETGPVERIDDDPTEEETGDASGRAGERGGEPSEK
jgi:hypothetical protein